MKRHFVRTFTLLAAVMLLSVTFLQVSAHARAGGGRSFGGSSRSYSRPMSPSQTPYRQPYSSAPNSYQQPSGGFLRGMAGGMAGGMLGSMLFSGSAGAGGMGGGTGGGGGIGLFEIILLAGGGYLLYRLISKRQQ